MNKRIRTGSSVPVPLSPPSLRNSSLAYRRLVIGHRAFALLLFAASASVGCERGSPLAPSVAGAAAIEDTSTEKRSDHVITIRKGSLVFLHEGQGGPLNISGTRGFRFDGFVQGGRFGADTECTTECPPGAAVQLGAQWSGSSVLGDATLQGQTYTGVGGSDQGRSSAHIEIGGGVTMPPLEAGPVTVTTSFELSGLFFAVDPISIATERFRLSGRGTVTLTLLPGFNIVGWRIVRAEFEFD